MSGHGRYWVLLGVAALAAASARAAFVTTGVYDENVVQANTVDASATPLTVGSFTTSVSTAYAAGKGGVVDFAVGSLTSGNIDASYAPTAGAGTETKTLSIGVTAGTTLAAGILPPISGPDTSNILKAPGGGNITFTLGAVSGAPDEKVTSFGFTLLTQTILSAVAYTATATFDDATTSVVTKTINRNTTSPTMDNFWGFSAPTGHYITSVALTTNAALNRDVTHIDDVGFVTSAFVVPEPSAMAMLAGAACLLNLRMRKKA